MALRRPLALIAGLFRELPLGDAIPIEAGGTGVTTAAAAREALAVREKLSAARTYYVRTDGSDSNDGLSNTAGGAFATIQKAWDTISTLDGGGNTATIQVANGTYAAGLNAVKIPVGFSSITISGNAGSPTSCNISTTGTCIYAGPQARFTLTGFKLATTSGALFQMEESAHCNVRDVEVGASPGNYQFFSNGGNMTITGTVRVIGGGIAFACAQNGGRVGFTASVTLVGTPAYSAFAIARDASRLVFFSTSFTGSATGQRYIAELNGVINTYGSGETFLPGNTAGAKVTGGQYA